MVLHQSLFRRKTNQTKTFKRQSLFGKNVLSLWAEIPAPTEMLLGTVFVRNMDQLKLSSSINTNYMERELMESGSVHCKYQRWQNKEKNSGKLALKSAWKLFSERHHLKTYDHSNDFKCSFGYLGIWYFSRYQFWI